MKNLGQISMKIDSEDLDIDLDEEVTLTCTATGMKVIFTSDRAKYAEA
jgi:hypothetical protein